MNPTLATIAEIGARCWPPSEAAPDATPALAERHPIPSRLAELEAVVHRGQCAFYEVGKALRTIRDERLYDAAFGSFEAYCKVRFQMPKAEVNRMILAAGRADNLVATESDAAE